MGVDLGSINFGKRADLNAINYAGTANEERNRSHYATLVEMANNSPSQAKDALVVGSGAGYGAFYLNAMGFDGNVVAEEFDLNSTIVANFVKQYFGHDEVRANFQKNGLKTTTQDLVNMVGDGLESNPVDNITFLNRNSTLGDEGDRPYKLVVCDNLHTPEFLGERGVQDLSVRLCFLADADTLLSYRCGTERPNLYRAGFKPTSNSEILLR